MGYNTIFEGVLKITPELKASEIIHLSNFFGEDKRDHPEWVYAKEFTYIDLLLTDDFSGIKWDKNAKKTYDMINQVNFIINEMKKICPDFKLSGEFLAQGERMGDRWKLVINNSGLAEDLKINITGKKIECPCCGESFLLEE